MYNLVGYFVSGITSLNDDEYKWAGVEDPKILITTSRDPSSRLKTFAKVCSHSLYRNCFLSYFGAYFFWNFKLTVFEKFQIKIHPHPFTTF